MFAPAWFSLAVPSAVTTVTSLVLLPWKWFWSWLYPPPEFPMPPIPIVGHLPYAILAAMSSLRAEKAVQLMSKFAGFPVFKAWLGRLPVVFLNDVDSIKTAFERSDCCNSRPYTTFARVFFNDGFTMSSGKRWEKLKPIAIRTLEEYGASKKEFDDVLEENVDKMLSVVVPPKGDDGSEISPTLHRVVDFKHYFFAVSMSTTLWVVTKKKVDITSKEFEKFVTTTVQTVLGKAGHLAWYDTMPPFLMRILPNFLTGMGLAENARAVVHDYLMKIILEELETRKPGKPRHVLDVLFDELLDPSVKEYDMPTIRREILYPVADLVCSPESAGSAIGWSLGYLAANPYDQKKVQEEIDALNLKPGQLPVYGEHRDRMPYTVACLHEAVRLGTPSAMSFPHFNPDSECKFKEFSIPKETMILANLYAAHRDPKYFPKPEEFRPNRFLESTDKGEMLKDINGFLAFSVGQRRCPAENLAWHIIFKTICAVLNEFDVYPERPVASGGRAPWANIWLPFIRAPSTMTYTVRPRHAADRGSVSLEKTSGRGFGDVDTMKL